MVWCCAQVLWRRREVRLGTEPGSEPRAWDSAPSCECRVGGQVQGGVRTEDSRGGSCHRADCPRDWVLPVPTPSSHTFTHLHVYTHTHTHAHILSLHTHPYNIKFTHQAHTHLNDTYAWSHAHFQNPHTHMLTHSPVYKHNTHTNMHKRTLIPIRALFLVPERR